MLRDDERAAWNGFFAAAPQFAAEAIASVVDGPDPPDVLCLTVSGKRVGVELTKWVEHNQITSGKAQEFLERSYLKVVASENEPRPDHIGWVWLYPKSRIKQTDQARFRTELFLLLELENAKADPEWDNPQGASVNDFSAFPMLAKHLHSLWVHPRSKLKALVANEGWVKFEGSGGAYTPQWMVQAVLDRIHAKIVDYDQSNLHGLHSLNELYLLCYYCDEALLYNTPTEAHDFNFAELTRQVAQVVANDHGVFDKIFLFNPYERQQVVQIYPA